jgi:RimJ/RimL family protein N-acetyltransferase
MPIQVVRYHDAARFYADAEALWMMSEAAYCLTIGIVSTLIARHDTFGEQLPVLALVRDAAGQVQVSAVRTPSRSVVLAGAADDALLSALVDDLAADMPDLPGAIGTVAQTHAFADAWCARSGASWQVGVHERIYQCEQVIPPRPTPGVLRRAVIDDVELVVDHVMAFEAEAFGITPDQEARARWAHTLFTMQERAMYLWEDGGEVVCCVGVTGPTPNGLRIGPVYTPPRFRGRGYASAATAAVTRIILEGGKRFAFLYTDLANPISNAIYQRIGYVPVVDADMIRFTPPGQ